MMGFGLGFINRKNRLLESFVMFAFVELSECSLSIHGVEEIFSLSFRFCGSFGSAAKLTAKKTN